MTQTVTSAFLSPGTAKMPRPFVPGVTAPQNVRVCLGYIPDLWGPLQGTRPTVPGPALCLGAPSPVPHPAPRPWASASPGEQDFLESLAVSKAPNCLFVYSAYPLGAKRKVSH